VTLLALLLSTILVSGPIKAYDRFPRNPECTRFHSEERSRVRFTQLLEFLGGSMGYRDKVWMVDTPFEVRLQEASTGKLYEIPQEVLLPKDRGKYRSYLVVLPNTVESFSVSSVDSSFILDERR
jgi:hypothetical protein